MPVSIYKLALDAPVPISESAQVSYTEAVIHNPIIVADGASDTSINFGGVTTIDVLYLKANQALTFKFNASATAYPVDANRPFFSAGTAITAITVSNASGSAANLYMIGLGA